MTTIFHVEDDELLAGAVQSAFEAFGFAGRFLTASTVREAEDLLAEASPTIDLVISDMSLPCRTPACRSPPVDARTG
jgi:DNA-binding response OmpR family regulator